MHIGLAAVELRGGHHAAGLENGNAVELGREGAGAPQRSNVRALDVNDPEHRTLDRGDELDDGLDVVTDVGADVARAEAGRRDHGSRASVAAARAGGSGSVAGGDLGPGPSPQPTTTNSTPAGTGTIFTLFVKNNDATGPATQTYGLAASQSTSFPGTLPAGWTVKFVAAGGTCTAAAITSVTVAAGAQQQVDACVTPPATQTPVTAQPIYFRVQSSAVASTGVLVSDAKHDAVTVVAAQTLGATLTPNNVGQVAPGGTVVYAHTLTNTGSLSCGAYTLTATKRCLVARGVKVTAVQTTDVRLKALHDLAQRSKVDAIWMLNDNALVRSPDFVDDAWRAELTDAKVPLIVGVPNLVEPGSPLATLAVVPDHEALGLQAANLLFELSENDWQVERFPVELPLSVRTVVDLKLVRANFGLRPEALKHIDHALE